MEQVRIKTKREGYTGKLAGKLANVVRDYDSRGNPTIRLFFPVQRGLTVCHWWGVTQTWIDEQTNVA